MDNSLVNPLRAMAGGLSSTAPVSSNILAGLAEDFARGGPAAAVLCTHPAVGSPLFGIRVLAGLHHLVLLGQADELAAHLTEARENSMADGRVIVQSWDVARAAILDKVEYILAALDRPVQQHQPDRGRVLLHGLALLGATRVRLLEIGACAGLNLIVDRYSWHGPGWAWGDPDSPVRLTSPGPAPDRVEIVHRAGCDLAPRDPANPADVAILRSFVPPEHTAARAELDGALRLAAETGVTVERAGAARWLAAELDQVADESIQTVVWHSLVWNYLDRGEQHAVDDVLSRVATRVPVARIGYEPSDWTQPPQLRLVVYGA